MGVFNKYWSIYGGASALFRSRYLHVSIILTILLYPTWITHDWYNQVLSIIPNLLGFSLGGFAIFLALGDEKFRKIISGDGNKKNDSPFLSVNATFVHFILSQVIAIIMALLGKAYDFEVENTIINSFFYTLKIFFAFFSYLFFMYALMCVFAATLSLFRVSTWYDAYVTSDKSKKDDKNEG